MEETSKTKSSRRSSLSAFVAVNPLLVGEKAEDRIVARSLARVFWFRISHWFDSHIDL